MLENWLKKIENSCIGLFDTLDDNGKLHSVNGEPSRIHLLGTVLSVYWHNHGKLQSFNDEPALLKFDMKNNWFCFEKTWYENGEFHRVNGPARTCYGWLNPSRPVSEYYYELGKLHRVDGPAVLEFHYSDFNVQKEKYYENGKLHRLDGPAYYSMFQNERETRWVENGHIHRSNLPAVIKHEWGDLTEVSYWNQGKLKVSSSDAFERVKILFWPNTCFKKIEYGKPNKNEQRRLVSFCSFHENGVLRTIVWNKSNNIMEPLRISWDSHGRVTKIKYDSKHENWDVLKPCEISYSRSGVTKEVFMRQGKQHSIIGPAIIKYDKKGRKKESSYYIMGVEYYNIDKWREQASVFAREEKNQASGVVMTDISF